jgi:hypothetical protein
MGIFEPFRAIGYITAGGVPFSVQRLGTETFVTVSVGKAFHVYNVSRHPTACPRLFYRLKKKLDKDSCVEVAWSALLEFSIVNSESK